MIQIAKGKLDYYTTKEAKCAWNSGNPSGHLLELPGSVLKVNRKLQPNPVKMTHGPDPSETKIWVIPPVKNQEPLRYLMKEEGIQKGL